MRRIKLKNGKSYQLRPSFMMPYMIARTDEVEKALYLRRGESLLKIWSMYLVAIQCSGIEPMFQLVEIPL
jgi:hypothetical protein